MEVENKTEKKNYSKIFYEKNPSKLKEKKECEICGGKYMYYNKNHHTKTKKHMQIVKLNELLKQNPDSSDIQEILKITKNNNKVLNVE